MPELRQALRDRGLHAELAWKLSPSVLRQCAYPLILHVKRGPADREYNHYILFLGDKDGKAMIFDPPYEVQTVPYSDLAPRWYGAGIVVSSRPIDLNALFAPARKEFIVWVLVAGAGVLCVRAARPHWMKRVMPSYPGGAPFLLFAQVFGLIMVSLTWAVVWNMVADTGILNQSGSIAALAASYREDDIPEVRADQLKKLLDSNTTVIDARFRADFKAGHIEGAISIPVDANSEERKGSLAGVPRDRPIIVYCQSGGCGFARKVAGDLIAEGYSHVSIYRGGWMEWSKTAKGGSR